MNKCVLLSTVFFLCWFSAIASIGAQDSAENAIDHGEEKHTNRLVHETSPYLYSHAHNPVDWYPWGEEALEKAKKENKLIFLSVGYSSCHWCHVMEAESFMDEEIAEFMNENFVCIKVDREERPDIDSIYMRSLIEYQRSLVSGGTQAGWPLSMFLTPDARPFYGRTYVPPHDGDRGVKAGFLSIIRNIVRVWKNSPGSIEADAEQITRRTIASLANSRWRGDLPTKSLIHRSVANLKQQFDQRYGGFGFNQLAPDRPKFPEASKLELLLDRLEKDPQNEAVEGMLTTTLDRMMTGGIWDHVGGGFHRYSVDRFWRIPHFEKMLYDNGQLASIYARASRLLENEQYAKVADQIVEFVLREMTDPQGGFYSALDADTEGEEGKFYRWTKTELEQALDAEQFAVATSFYNLDKGPNFEGKYFALQPRSSIAEKAKQANTSADELEKQISEINKKFYESRSKRVRPLTDDKILVSWNGLMISGMAWAGEALDRSDYVEHAAKAADFIWNKMRQDDGRLYRTYSKGEARLNAYLEDYAFFIEAMLTLHQITKNEVWLERSIELQKKQDELFWDQSGIGYFFTSHDHESLLARVKEAVDREIPSGSTVTSSNLAKLYQITGDSKYKDRAVKTIRSISGLMERFPSAAPRALIGLRLLELDKEK